LMEEGGEEFRLGFRSGNDDALPEEGPAFKPVQCLPEADDRANDEERRRRGFGGIFAVGNESGGDVGMILGDSRKPIRTDELTAKGSVLQTILSLSHMDKTDGPVAGIPM
ncbi:MAG: hypothetical protein WCW53_05010, partial [Syntrophales bacterium]